MIVLRVFGALLLSTVLWFVLLIPAARVLPDQLSSVVIISALVASSYISLRICGLLNVKRSWLFYVSIFFGAAVIGIALVAALLIGLLDAVSTYEDSSRLQTLESPTEKTQFILSTYMQGMGDREWYVHGIPIGSSLNSEIEIYENEDDLLFSNYSESGDHEENPHIEIVGTFLVFSRGGFYHSLYDIERKEVLVNHHSPWHSFQDSNQYKQYGEKPPPGMSGSGMDAWVRVNLHEKIASIIKDVAERIRVPKLADYGTDMKSLEKFSRDLDAIPLAACRNKKMGVDLAYCIYRKSSDNKLTHLRDASRLGNPLAQNDLANLIDENNQLGDSAEIRRLISASAAYGIPHAQVTVGWWHMTGEHGFAVNYEESMKWNMKGYNQGHGEGANNIGELYEKGLGVPTNIENAKTWYKNASALGNAEAKERLERLANPTWIDRIKRHFAESATSSI